jgi:hypothetical protein
MANWRNCSVAWEDFTIAVSSFILHFFHESERSYDFEYKQPEHNLF